MRYQTRNLLLVVAVAAVLCGFFVAGRNLYFADRREIYSVLAEVKGISSIQLHPQDEFFEEIEITTVSVDGRPNSIIELGGLTDYDETGRFSIGRIAQWRFKVWGCRVMGATDSETGKPVESNYLSDHIEFGRQSPYNALLPFEVKTLQDVVDHYQDLVELFDSWPSEAKPGQVTLEDGSIQYFYVLEVAK